MTKRIKTILTLIGVSVATFAFARDESVFGGASMRSGYDTPRGSSRTSASAQEAPRASAPSSPSPTASALRSSSVNTERARITGDRVAAPEHGASRTTYAPAPAAQTVRQPDVTVVAPSRDTSRTTYIPTPSAQTVRQPDVTVVAPSRNTDHTSLRTVPTDSARTERTRPTEVTRTLPPPAETRTVSTSRTPVNQRSVTADAGASSRSQTPSEGTVFTHSRTEMAPALRHTDSAAASTSLSHEPLDGRSDSFRTPTGERTTALSPDSRHSTWLTSPTTTRTAASPRLDTASSAATRARLSNDNRLTSASSLQSTREDPANDRNMPSSVNRALYRTTLRESQARITSSGHRDVGSRHPSDEHVAYSPSFGSTALHQMYPNEPPRRDPYRYPSYYRHPDVYRPVWWNPVVYPVVGFGLTWGSGGCYAFTSSSCSPAYAYSYSYMPYYDSWHYGRQGCSSVYYGGWRQGWYGGFSYVYNPWPVYSTYYFEDTPQVVTQTETVYVTQPAVTTTPTPAPEALAVPQETAPSVSYPPPVPTSEAPVAAMAQTAVSNNAPEVAVQAPAANGAQRDDGSADYVYETTAEDFALDFASYAETLNAEMIWSSYAGFDRPDAGAELHLNSETAAIPSH